MKKIYSFKNLCRISIAGLMFLTVACQKPNEVQTFDDIFDISGIMDLNRKIDQSESASDLAGLLANVDISVPESISASKIEQIYKNLEQITQLTASEKEKLLRNDPEALLQVLTRFGNLPSECGNKNMNFNDLQNSSMNKYLLVQKADPGVTYYPEDYYSAVQAYKNYVENCIIKPLKKIHTILLHDESELPEGAVFEYFVLITMNNNWDMWWSYWSYGNIMIKIKHKGGSGSFPG